MAYRYQPAASLRDKAKGFLNGKYRGAVGTTFMYAGVAYVMSMLLGQISAAVYSVVGKIAEMSIVTVIVTETILYIVSGIVTAILSVMIIGLALYYLKIGSKSMPRPSDLFAGFREGFSRNFGVSLGVIGPGLIAMLPASLAIVLVFNYGKMEYVSFLIISAIIGLLVYVFFYISLEMAYYIANDFPNYSARQVIKAAWSKISGHRWRLFCMEFSFLPYYVLTILTMGIGVFWVFPLIQETRAQFYLDLMNPKQTSGEWEHTV